MVVHEKIREKFEIHRCRFEVIGFLRDGEPSVDGHDMLRRVVQNNGKMTAEEEESYIMKYRTGLPVVFQSFKLITRRHHPSNSRFISEIYFNHGRRTWAQFWRDLDDECDRSVLFVHSCV
ncbi:MAG: hypothetical protein Q8O88_05450 [bacterium]|nr:hypothetical protein [bacterium]